MTVHDRIGEAALASFDQAAQENEAGGPRLRSNVRWKPFSIAGTRGTTYESRSFVEGRVIRVPLAKDHA